MEVTRIELDPSENVKIGTDFEKGREGKIVLNRHDYWVNYFKKEAEGKLTFLSFFGGSSKKQSLLIQKDYVHWQENNGKRAGILIRLEADVETLDSEFKIEKFQDFGAAAQLGIARGRISVRVWGLDGPPIYKLTMEVDLSAVSLANIENQTSDLHSKIMSDNSLIIAPVILPDSTFQLRNEGRK